MRIIKKVFCSIIVVIIALSFGIVGCDSSDSDSISYIYISGDTSMEVGDVQTLTITNNIGTTNYDQYHFLSSDTSVATIDGTACVTAVSAGKTTITVLSTNGVAAKLNITVTEAQKEYLTNDSVTYSTNHQTLTFSLVDKNDNYITANGSVKIVIKNKMYGEVYSKTRSFTKKDFVTSGTKSTCTITISDDDITKGLYDTGTLSATITTEDTEFSAKSYSVTNLPLSFGVELTNSTGTFSDYSSSGSTKYSTTRVDSSNIEYSLYTATLQEKIKITLSVVCTCIYLKSTWSYSTIGYKIYDDDNILIKTDNFIMNIDAANTTWSKSTTFYLDIGNYTITFCDALI